MTFLLKQPGTAGFVLHRDRLQAGDDPQLGFATAVQGLVCLALHGYLDLDDGPVLAGELAAERLLARYLRGGEAFLDGLRGGYAVVVDDLRTGRRYAARDAVGEGALFVARTGDEVALGTDPRRTAAAAGAERPSRTGFAQFLLLNYTLGDGWYVEGVRPLPPGELHLVLPSGTCRLRTTAGYPGLDGEDGPAPQPGALSEHLAAASTRLLGGPAALHLSGGVDTSLIAHALNRPHGRRELSTYNAFYQADDADRVWAASVAAEVGSRHHEVGIDADRGFLDSVSALANALGAPVMAIGVPTFRYLAEAAAAQGTAVVLSGIAADHPLVGWNRLQRLQDSPVPPGDLPVRCAVHVPPGIVAPYVADSGLATDLAQVQDRLREAMPYGGSLARSIERFHAEHFLPEHLRSAAVAHAAYGVAVRHPFLDAQVSGLGFRAARRPEEAAGKRYLRRELDALGCWAAARIGKQQQALTFGRFRTLAREQLLDRLAAGPDLFGLDTGKLAALAASDRPAPDQELRLLWLVHSYLVWQESQAAVPATTAA